MNRWPHQIIGTAGVLGAIDAGHVRICLTSPTGGGKSVMMCDLIERVAEEGWNAVLYTNRRMLTDQLLGVLAKHGISCGVRASGHKADLDQPVQISSIPTERARSLKSERWELHGAGKRCLAVIDEAHLNSTGAAREILDWHREQGHVALGITATPLGLGGVYDHLVVAGRHSELRNCGALVAAEHYGCDEPDMKALKAIPEGVDLSENQAKKAMMTPTIWGRVVEWYRKLNPTDRPTLLFAPGVAESLWFAEQFEKAGVAAAHIDGSVAWIRGSLYRRERGDKDPAADILRMSKDGEIKVICNRFVLREGVDAPWLSHGILATVFGGLGTYLQAGGRLLRSYPGLKKVTIQDHGGHWWRHGSLNADRQWEIDAVGAMVSGLRADRLRLKQCQRCKAPLERGMPVCGRCAFLNEIEPVLCPACSQILRYFKCPCGWVAPPAWRPSRAVVQTDGSLKQHHGDIFKAYRVSKRPDGPRQWERLVLFRSGPTKKDPDRQCTFRQLAATYARENQWGWPDRINWPLMPLRQKDWYARVCDVPKSRLTPPLPKQEKANGRQPHC